MDIAKRIRDLRTAQNLSQGDIEQRTGLLRCYISRVENGHNVPSLETLEKLARALEVPLYQLFYQIEQPSDLPIQNGGKSDWASHGKGARMLRRFRETVSRLDETERALVLHTATAMSRKKRKA